MSADGDTVRAALSLGMQDSLTLAELDPALAALARLEAAESQRDALAEALGGLLSAVDSENFNRRGHNSISTSLRAAITRARAALAEAGL